VTSVTKFGTTVRLQTAKEFKSAQGLKGQDGRRAYNAYLREQGKASTAGLAAALTGGELLVRSYRDSKGSVGVNFIKASAIKDPVAKADRVVPPVIDDAAVMAFLGVTAEQFAAMKAMAPAAKWSTLGSRFNPADGTPG
jgi:hypothetical protein